MDQIIISKKRKSGAGFTLAELLVAMAIFGMLIALVIANFNKGAETNKLKEASLKLAQNIRAAQNYSISGKSLWRCRDNKAVKCETDANCGGTDKCENKVPAGGFGLYVTGNIYNIYTDQYENTYNAPSRTFKETADGSAVIYENMASSFVFMKAYKLSGQSGNQPMPGTIDITFEPPTGKIHFCINLTECSTIDKEAADNTISFLIAKINDPNHNCRKITINKVSGQVSEEGNINCVL